jgi:hypothetical protein
MEKLKIRKRVMRIDALAPPIVDASRPEKPSELERRNGRAAERLDRKDMTDVQR